LSKHKSLNEEEITVLTNGIRMHISLTAFSPAAKA